MTIYTVHEPPSRDADAPADTDRFVFVRDGFYGWAFLLGPLWLLWRRLWLVLLCYVVLTAALQALLWHIDASGTVRFAVGLLIALLVGMEAGSLRRWTLNRRKWKNLGVVVASNIEAAERRFFDTWVGRKPPMRSISASMPPVATLRMPPTSPEVIGLFPQPEPHR
jgi:hypothetical protein